jgi:hypothetical protein
MRTDHAVKREDSTKPLVELLANHELVAEHRFLKPENNLESWRTRWAWYVIMVVQPRLSKNRNPIP